MKRPAAVLVCNGRALDEFGQSTGPQCGRVLEPAAAGQLVEERARAAGWKVGPLRADGSRDVMCDRCGRPDPAIRAALREVRP